MRGKQPLDLFTALLGAAAMVALAPCLGLIANHLSASPLPLFASAATLRAPVSAGISYMSVGEVRARLGQPGVLVADGRPLEAFAAGHLPGACSLPVEAFAEADVAMRGDLEHAQQVICYCDSIGCDEAARLARLLSEGGYQRIAVMFEGFEGWREAGYPTETGQGSR